MHDIRSINRRDFLKLGLGTGAGLALGFSLPGTAGSGIAGPGQAGNTAVGDGGFEPNAFLRITTDNRVTVIAKHLEMGQGSYTGLATLVAEELDAAWEQVNVIGAPADAKRYNNLFWGQAQGTGGSTAMANSWQQMRKAGAAARAMLVSAAAERWQVDSGTLEVAEGVISHPTSGRSASFGELAEVAAEGIMPDDVALKNPSRFRLIGKRVPRKDTRAKIDGSAVFTQDLQLPGMLIAVVAHPPRFGARVGKVDDRLARLMEGVEAVLTLDSGVAVVARDFWSARKARDALKIDWDESAAFKLGSDEIFERYAELAGKPGAVARNEGDALAELKASETVVEAEYRYPFLAHAAMEPLNCVIQRRAEGVEVWNGEQMQTVDQANVAAVFGLQPSQVKINMLYSGGSFGRRANPKSDYVVEAAHIVKALGRDVPVKLMWTREDDMRGGWYRPLNLHRLRAVLDADGMPHAWHHRLVGQSIVSGTPFQGMIKDGIDPTSVEGASNLPYQVPNLHVDLHSPELGVPIQWWRSVGSTHTAYSVETFIDQLAVKAGKDPVDYRLALLKDHPRHRAVLELAARKANWGKQAPPALAPGRKHGRGVALHESFNSYVAMVVDVTVDDDGYRPRVDRVVIAVDCGIAINPDIVRSQMEGGMGFGLAMLLGSQVSLKKGRVVESNFHNYRVLGLSDMPDVEVHIVASAEAPTGVGEPATPVIAPAVANAIAAATGVVHRVLPLNA